MWILALVRFFCVDSCVFFFRLDDVEAKLAETEKEADKARKESRNARDRYHEIKNKRCVFDKFG